MPTNIKKISTNNSIETPIHLKFKKTNVYKIIYGTQMEELLFSYDDATALSTVYKGQYSGINTAITLGKPKLFNQFNAINNSASDYLNFMVFLPDFVYEKNESYNWETATAIVTNFIGVTFQLTIGRNFNGYFSEICISYEDYYISIRMTEPLDWCFE